MKKFIIMVTVAILIPLMAEAQSSFQDFYDSYATTEGFTSMTMSNKMIKAIASKSKDEGLVQLLKGIQSIMTLSTTKSDTQMVSDLHSYLSDAEFSKMGERYEDGQRDQFYFKDGLDQRPSTFIMLNVNDSKTTVIRIYGYFDVKDVTKLSHISK